MAPKGQNKNDPKKKESKKSAIQPPSTDNNHPQKDHLCRVSMLRNGEYRTGSEAKQVNERRETSEIDFFFFFSFFKHWDTRGSFFSWNVRSGVNALQC